MVKRDECSEGGVHACDKWAVCILLGCFLVCVRYLSGLVLACFLLLDIFQIVNCKDEKTFGEPKAYMTPRVLRKRSIVQEMIWPQKPLDPYEPYGDILMIPTSLDNCHPDAKVIGLYQVTSFSAKNINK